MLFTWRILVSIWYVLCDVVLLLQVYVHVDESLHGMEVIKAFNAVNFFIQENIQRINKHHLALFNTEQCHLWLAFWCDFFGAVLVVATCLFSVGLKDDLGSAAVGLAISNTIQVRPRALPDAQL